MAKLHRDSGLRKPLAQPREVVEVGALAGEVRGNWNRSIPSFCACRNGASADQNISKACSSTRGDGLPIRSRPCSLSLSICFKALGRRAVSAACWVSSANALILKMKPGGVRCTQAAGAFSDNRV